MKHLEDYGDVMTPKDVKDFLGIGFNKTYELLATRQIKNFRVGRSIRIPKKFVEEYITESSK